MSDHDFGEATSESQPQFFDDRRPVEAIEESQDGESFHSPPASTSESDKSTSSNFAFLVHSEKTLKQNLPPRVDNKLLARQRRRRTRYVIFFFALY